MAEQLWHALQGLPPWLVVAVLSAAPISEVRGGIPVGLCVYKMPLWAVLPIAVVSAVVVVLWVVPTYNWLAATFDDTPILGRIFRWLTHHAGKRKRAVERYGFLAVTLFVAVPLPGFGGWTGSVLAAVCRLSFREFVAALVLGTLVASAVVTGLTLGGVHILDSIKIAQ